MIYINMFYIIIAGFRRTLLFNLSIYDLCTSKNNVKSSNGFHYTIYLIKWSIILETTSYLAIVTSAKKSKTRLILKPSALIKGTIELAFVTRGWAKLQRNFKSTGYNLDEH